MQRAPGNCSSARVSRISFVLLYHWRVAFKVDGSAWRGGTKTVFTRRILGNCGTQGVPCEEKVQDCPWLIPAFPETYTPCSSLHFRGKIAQ